MSQHLLGWLFIAAAPALLGINCYITFRTIPTETEHASNEHTI